MDIFAIWPHTAEDRDFLAVSRGGEWQEEIGTQPYPIAHRNKLILNTGVTFYIRRHPLVFCSHDEPMNETRVELGRLGESNPTEEKENRV
jgi:hypothetical protein